MFSFAVKFNQDISNWDTSKVEDMNENQYDTTYDNNKKKQHGGYTYDTSKVKNAHFDKDYAPEGISVPIDLEAMENAYQISKEIFDKDKRKILNASPGTMLDTFEKISYDKLF